MTDQLVIDFDHRGRMTVLTARNHELPQPCGEPTTPTWPVYDDALDDLRWYLEDYLRAPYAVYEDRGAAIATRLTTWAESLFNSVFGAGPARDAYQRWRQRTSTPGTGELVFRSDTPAWLGLPWELLRDPDHTDPLALAGVALTRSMPTAHLPDTFDVPGDRLRVLMVIARPAGGGDVGYRMIARPLLHRLAAVRGTVDLRVLRPPTPEALETTLRQARESGQPYQIVHFDGHGALTGTRAVGAGAPHAYGDPTGAGVLAFEKPSGGADLVPAERIARILGEAQVPVVVLNACQSGAVGKQVESTVATRLLAGGAAAVVAMAYSVYAVAAAEFTAAFYEHLFAGDTIAEAVRAGRARMASRPQRPTPKGDLPLADWAVPVHYHRRDVQFSGLRAASPVREGLSLDQVLDQLRVHDITTSGQDDLAAIGEFVGRDDLFYTLEVAIRAHRVVVLHGLAGVGKTELAKAFGRWWRDTGGVDDPDLVIWHSFKPGIASFGLDGVIATIGNRVFGAEFGLLDADRRRSAVELLLAERRVLLIWDNFESAASMPDDTAATPPLDQGDRTELAAFLARVAARGHSAVLVTSRTQEAWLGDRHRVSVGGLTHTDAISYADNLLAGYPNASPRRHERAFGELLEWLDGHPLAMRVMLPHLDATGPAELLAGLRGTASLPEGSGNATLAASLTYSLTHLDPDDQRVLVALSLVEGVADAQVLAMFSADEQTPARFRDLDSAGWVGVLDRAAQVGLLCALGSAVYSLHPALPAYLVARWRSEDSNTYHDQQEASGRALLVAYAQLGSALYSRLGTGDAALAVRVLGHHRRMLGRMLSYGIEHRLWARVQQIVQPLHTYLEMQGLVTEARLWRDRGRAALEDPSGSAPALDQPSGTLWLFLVGKEADWAYEMGRLDEAAAAYTEIADMLYAQSSSPAQRARLAVTYHQLGMVARLRGELDEAEQWYHKALTIKERLNDRSRSASTYHELGLVAQLRGRLDEADQQYRKALVICQEFDNQSGLARIYHQLGMVARLRGRLDEAYQWYHKALTIVQCLNDRSRLPTSYYELGLVAQLRGRLDEADQWYHEAVAIAQNLDDREILALTFAQIGLLAEQRGQLHEALGWNVRCVSLFDEIPHPQTGTGLARLAELTDQLGIPVLEQQWVKIVGKTLPANVRAVIDAYPTDTPPEHA